jgi:hypothetical protein
MTGISVIGVQASDGTGAQALAGGLGYSYQSSGDLGIVSAYPVSAVTPPADATPAAGVTLDVYGQPVRVWVVHLDESDYGPDREAAGDTDLVAYEKTTVRYAQAVAIAREMADDIASARQVPVILLGDLASPSGLDGSIDWPVPDVFARAGLPGEVPDPGPGREVPRPVRCHPGGCRDQGRAQRCSDAGNELDHGKVGAALPTRAPGPHL